MLPRWVLLWVLRSGDRGGYEELRKIHPNEERAGGLSPAFSVAGLLLQAVTSVCPIPCRSSQGGPLCFLPPHVPRALRVLGTQRKRSLALDRPSPWLIVEGDCSPQPSLAFLVSHVLGLGCGAHLSWDYGQEHKH